MVPDQLNLFEDKVESLPSTAVAKVLLPTNGEVFGVRGLTLADCLEKGMGIAGYVDTICKALTAPPGVFNFGQLQTLPDPNAEGIIAWPGLPPETLRKMAATLIAPKIVIQSRVNDVLAYAQLSRHPWKKGWAIEMMDGKAQPSTNTLRQIRQAEQFIANCNIEYPYREARERDSFKFYSFPMYLAMITRDSYTYDGMATWTDMDMDNRVKGFSPLPAGNIRLAGQGGYLADKEKAYVLVDEGGTIYRSFTRDELTWTVRNPRTDAVVGQYGLCCSEDTEVLTNNGWKSFKDIILNQDLIATMTQDTHKFEWQPPRHITWQKYSGKMYRFYSRSVDLLVTPNHRIVYSDVGSRDFYRIITASQMNFLHKTKWSPRFTMPAVSIWDGHPIADKEFVKSERFFRKQNIKFSGKQYCAFMGAFLAEGYTTNESSVTICQNKTSKGYDKYLNLLNEIVGIESYSTERKFIFTCPALAKHLNQFGTSAKNKTIPDEIMEATPEEISIFLEYFSLGDGSFESIKNPRYYKNIKHRTTFHTSSKKMADQIQELAQKTGYSAYLSEHTSKGSIRKIKDDKGNIVKKRFPDSLMYSVDCRFTPNFSFKIEEQIYEGYIGCVTTDNGIIYTRRKGRPIWTGNSELDAAAQIIDSIQNAFELNGDIFTKCYSEDTEVLTDNGWKTFDKVDIEIDLIATMDQETREFQWQKATYKTWESYSGDMYRFHSRSLDLLVTPNHRMIYCMEGSLDKLKVLEAKNLAEKRGTKERNFNYKLPSKSIWTGTPVANVYIETGSNRGRNFDISGNDYCALMGAYLSEGHTDNYESKKAYICQKTFSKGFLPYKNLTTKLFGKEIYYDKSNHRFVLCSLALANHFRQFGSDSYSKKIPQEIMDSTPEQINIFLHYFTLGDGRIEQRKITTSPRGNSEGYLRTITTTSKIMADQIQELAQKVGLAATFNIVKPGSAMVLGRECKTATLYHINFKTSPNHAFKVEKINYNGYMGCVSVPNGIIYVKRKERPIWCGNSGIPQGMLKLKGLGWSNRELDLITRTWNNLKKGVCYSEDTEVLTKKGWKTFNNVNIETDEFATMNQQTREFQWQKASLKVWESYEGDMYEFSSSALKLLVTPNHGMLYTQLNEDSRRIKDCNAEKLYSIINENPPDSIGIPVASIWRGKELTFEEEESAIKLYRESGKIYDKMMNATKYEIRNFLSRLYCFPSIKSFSVYDKNIADKFQELIQKLGLAAGIETLIDENGEYFYRISSANIAREYVPLKAKKIIYKGYIGCVEVPNGTLLVRRNGQLAWSKNTKYWALPALVLPPETDIEFMDLSAATGKDALFQEYINLVIGTYCAICNFPVRRLGYRISGKVPEPSLTEGRETAVSLYHEEDIGLVTFLQLIENMINQYILWTRWPNLRFVFRGKTPREDAREYEIRQMAMTFGERRALTDNAPLLDIVRMGALDGVDEAPTSPEEQQALETIARLVDLCPVDPAMIGMYQTLANSYMQSKYGKPTMGSSGEQRTPGAPMMRRKDPANSEEHGDISGIRRH